MKIYLRKTSKGLVAASEESQQIFEKLKIGQPYKCDINKTDERNLLNHRRYFKLLSIAYENWDPRMPPIDLNTPKANRCKKTFEGFRKSVIITAGFYDEVFNVDGSISVAAKSLKFDSMGEEEFQKLFSNSIDVILRSVLPDTSKEDLILQIIEFC